MDHAEAVFRAKQCWAERNTNNEGFSGFLKSILKKDTGGSWSGTWEPVVFRNCFEFGLTITVSRRRAWSLPLVGLIR
jgi:hypothetical protein